MAKQQKMTNSELVSILDSYRRDALGSDDNELSNERAKALDHYHGRPYGNEKEGRSAVVTRDLSETADWIMAPLMRIFMQTGNPVEFLPTGPEDEELAEQQTNYVNHVITKDNNAFVFLYDWFKDALLLKNGYIKHWWEESEKITEDEYEDLSEDELMLLLSNLEADGGEVTVVAQEEREAGLGPGGMPVMVYDVKVQVKTKTGRVRIEAVPVEEIRVSKDCRYSLQDAMFVEHVTKKTRTSLIEMGMDIDFVYELPAFGDDEDTDSQRRARDSVSDESDDYDSVFFDRSMDEIEYCEAYVLVDFNGDRIAERRKVITCAGRIPPGEEWNEIISSVPITGIVPKRIPHRHVGESLDDDISDLQEINTTLFRQLLDNIYRTNNQELVINDDAVTEDFLQNLPGGVKRVEGSNPVQSSVMALTYTPILNQIIPAIDHVNGLKEVRTGVNELNTNVSPDVLKESNNAVFLEGINKASQKTEMIARFFADGLKELVLRVHELLIKHQDRERIVKLQGHYVTVNPSEWRERTDLTVNVGLGTGSEEEKRQKLMLLAGMQEKIAQIGLVMPQHAYAMFEDIAKTLGANAPEKYAQDPSQELVQIPSQMLQQLQQAAQGGQTNPLAEAEQIKAQANMQIAQLNAQHKSEIEMLKEQSKQQMEQYKQQISQENKILELIADMNNKAEDRVTQEDIAALNAEVKMMIEDMKTDIGKAGIGSGVQEVARTFDPNSGAFI